MSKTPLNEKTPLTSSSAEPEDPNKQLYTILSICGLITVNVIKVQLTAHLFESQNYPTAYSFWSAICTIALLIPVFICKPSQFGLPTREMMPILTAVVLFTTFDMAFQNMALANASTALVMCIMATNPFWTVLIETALYCKTAHFVIYITVCMLVVGAVLVSLGSPITKAGTFGIVCACAGVLCSASKAVFTHDTFKQYKKVLTPMALLFWIDVCMLPIYIGWTIANGELPMMYDDAIAPMFAPGNLTAMDAVGESPYYKFSMLTATGALGGVRALMGFYVLSFVTATSTAVVNIFTQDLNILISIPLQHLPVTSLLATGLSTSMSTSAFFTYIKVNKGFLKKVDENCCGIKETSL